MSHYLKKLKRFYFLKKDVQLQKKYPQYEFGKGTYSGKLKIYDWDEGATLKVGSYCSIADGVQIFLGGEHNTDWVTTYPFNSLWKAAGHFSGHPKTKGDVTIGSDVWIGREAIIMSGVKIGDGAVIGARSVVLKDVNPYAIAGGNPALEIKKRFADDIIEKLLKICWWDWETKRIEIAMPFMLNKDINSFIQAVDNNEI